MILCKPQIALRFKFLALCGELLLDLGYLLLLRLFGGVPAADGHFLINAVLHAKTVVECGVKGLMNICCRRLDSAMHIQVANALGGKQQVFHDVSVVHFPILLKQGYKTA